MTTGRELLGMDGHGRGQGAEVKGKLNVIRTVTLSEFPQ